MQLLLEAGARPEMTDNFGSSALLEACTYGHDATIDILVQHGARLGSDGVEDASLLCTCVYEGNMPKLRRLLRAGLPVNAFDYDRRTATHISAAEGNLTAVGLGLTDVSIALHIAAFSVGMHLLNSCVCWWRRAVPTWASLTAGATLPWTKPNALGQTTWWPIWLCV